MKGGVKGEQRGKGLGGARPREDGDLSVTTNPCPRVVATCFPGGRGAGPRPRGRTQRVSTYPEIQGGSCLHPTPPHPPRTGRIWGGLLPLRKLEPPYNVSGDPPYNVSGVETIAVGGSL